MKLDAVELGSPASLPERSPHWLWSLWEMHQLKIDALIGAIDSITATDYIARNDPEWVYRNDGRVASMLGEVETITKQCQILDLSLAIKKAQSIKIKLEQLRTDYSPQTVSDVVSRDIVELRERIVQSLEDSVVYAVDPKKKRYLANVENMFPADVLDKLVEATYDLSEACSCLGMARNTACVFHLMRAIELSVKKLGAEIGVTIIDKHDKDLDWGKIISNLNAAIANYPNGVKRDELSAVVAMLYHVKNAWRNNTMHPKVTYTDEEAEAVFEASKSFLKVAASCLSAPLVSAPPC